VSQPEAVSDDQLASVYEAIDRAFSGAQRPEKFTDHPYCEECADAHDYFSRFTPATIADVTDPPETLPLSFLTDDAFHYLAPGILRWLPRSGQQYCVGDVLFHVENRLHTLSPTQRAALRHLLYLLYDHLKPEIDASPSTTPPSGASSTSLTATGTELSQVRGQDARDATIPSVHPWSGFSARTLLALALLLRQHRLLH
jgi:hypothetical protein